MKKPSYPYLIITLLLSIFLGSSLSRLLHFDIELAIDYTKPAPSRIRASTFHNNGSIIVLSQQSQDTFGGTVSIPGQTGEYQVQLKQAPSSTTPEIEVNGIQIASSRVLKARDALGFRGDDCNFLVVKLDDNSSSRAGFTVLYTAALLAILWGLAAFGTGQKRSWLVYSSDLFTHLKPLDHLLTALILGVSLFFYTGCDAIAMNRILKLFVAGIDPYQFQVNHKAFAQFEYPNFPYNPIMLFTGAIFEHALRPLYSLIPSLQSAEWGFVLPYKLAAILFHYLTVVALLSFLVSKGVLSRNARQLYYLALFNPVSFYIAVIYLQIDVIPLYFITVALLHLAEAEKEIFRSAAYAALALSSKMQMALQAPALGLAVAVSVFGSKALSTTAKVLRLAGAGAIFALLSALFILLHYRPTQALYHLLSNFTQTDRVWWLALPFGAGMVVFITIFALTLVHLLFTVRLHSILSRNNLVLATLLFCGSVVGFFSASLLQTPSSLIHLSVGIVILYAMQRDIVQRLCTALCSASIIANSMFNEIGDISRLIPGTQLFTDFTRSLPPADHSRYESVLLSISVAGLVCFSSLLLSKAFSLLGERCRTRELP